MYRNVPFQKLAVTAKQSRPSTAASRRNALRPPEAPERCPSSPSARRGSCGRRASVAPAPKKEPPTALPTEAAAVEPAKDEEDAKDPDAAKSKTEEAVKKFTITASKASTVFTIDLAELRRLRIKQGKTPGISK